MLDQCFSAEQMNQLKDSANAIVADFDSNSTRAVFSTEDHSKTRDDYFLSSGDKVRCFFEEDAFDEEGALNQDKSLSINKIGHAFTLHITCANTKYATENWLQAEPSLL